MGRIHRYGQEHDPVVILNLVAPGTREGKVLQVLLAKLEKVRQELHSDKVFDCIGRLFLGVSIKRYMELAVTLGSEEVARELDGRLTVEQVQALAAQEQSLFGGGGDIAKELPRLRADLEREVYFRLMPGYVRQYIQQAAPLVDLKIEGDMEGTFTFRPGSKGAFDPLLSVLESYPQAVRERFSLARPADRHAAIWLHPGEAVFECFRSLVGERLAREGQRGAVFVDPTAEKPYLFHLALISVVRKADAQLPGLAREELLACQLVGVKQYEGAELVLCPIEHLLLLKGGHGLPPSAQGLALGAAEEKETARAYLAERVARNLALEYKERLLKSIPEREVFIERGFNYQEADLAAARAKHAEKARKGNHRAVEALEQVKRQQGQLAGQREQALAVLRREPELIAPGGVEFRGHALVVPSSDPVELKQHEAKVEQVAMQVAQVFEEAAGGKVLDVHTPALARVAGLQDNPGFDLWSIYPGGEKRAIEVKGRTEVGAVEVSANEWAKACNMRQGYWLYVVYACATSTPRLVRVQDPFDCLLAKAKGSVLIGVREVVEAGIA